MKFFRLEGRFPQHAGELPAAAVDYVARQVGVAAAALARYDWTGRSIVYTHMPTDAAPGVDR